MNKKSVIFALVIALAMISLTVTVVFAGKSSGKSSFDGTLVQWGCEGDIDCDGVADGSDNCPEVANADQANKDGDAAGNVCDANPNNGNVSNFDGGDLAVKMSHQPTIPEDVESALSLKATLTGCGDCAGNTLEGSWAGAFEFVCINPGDNTVINASFSPGGGELGPVTIEQTDVSSNGKVILRLVAPADLPEVEDVCPNHNWNAKLTSVTINSLHIEHRNAAGELVEPPFDFDIAQDCESTGDNSFQCTRQ